MDQAKKGFLPVLQGVKLSKTQSLTTAEERGRMKGRPICSCHRLYTVCHAEVPHLMCALPHVWQEGTKVI